MRLGLAVVLPAVVLLAQAPSRTVWDGVYTASQASQGETLYTASCAGCHGNGLQGGESAPPLSGIEFFSNWNTLSVRDLFDRVRNSMPLDKPGSLSRDQNASIIAYILQFNKFPAGPAALPQRSEMLSDIKIEMYGPDAKQ